MWPELEDVPQVIVPYKGKHLCGPIVAQQLGDCARAMTHDIS